MTRTNFQEVTVTQPRLAAFDLDNTLLGGDSDHLWGRFLVDHGIVDAQAYERENDRFYRQYQTGTLDIGEFLAFALRPLAEHHPDTLAQWRERFIDERIRPIVLEAARSLVERHRRAGDRLLIITATNRFVTEPIAELFDIRELLATEPERDERGYTGRHVGVPTFREGKIHALEDWLARTGMSLEESTFYSDSHNDLPLLRRVTHPVAVDPDERLDSEARRLGWPRLSLRQGPHPTILPA
ncbi:MAG TPA: HAD family hydrolase [Gammaproteobacteria bacterium]|nr:HAD family hydrolase [Gammaproteobacteria bacterium]